jgi:hypothetical protein
MAQYCQAGDIGPLIQLSHQAYNHHQAAAEV